MNRFTSSFVVAALALTVAVSSASAVTITGVFTDRGTINGAKVFSFDITTDTALNGLDFTDSGGFAFQGPFNGDGIDTNFDFIADSPLTFAPTAPGAFQPGGLKESYFNFNAGLILSAQIDDAFPPPTPILGAAIAAPVGDLLPVGTTTVAIFSMVDPLDVPLLGNGTPFGIAGVGVVTATGAEEPITVIPEPASLVLLGLGLVGTFVTRRRSM